MGKIYQKLSIEERAMIQTQLKMGIKPEAIALGLNRSASILSRELRRNGWVCPKGRRYPGRPLVAGGYRAQAAHTLVERTTLFTVLSRMDNASADTGSERIQSCAQSYRGATTSFADLRSGPGNGGASAAD